MEPEITCEFVAWGCRYYRVQTNPEFEGVVLKEAEIPRYLRERRIKDGHHAARNLSKPHRKAPKETHAKRRRLG